MQLKVRLLALDDVDLVLSASDLFDNDPMPDQATAMLASDRDFLWFAIDNDRPVGFASATMTLHPDQRPVLFLNEIGVNENSHRRGIGRQLMQASIDLAKSRGWASTWVLADDGDERAKAFYSSLAPDTAQGSIMFEWDN